MRFWTILSLTILLSLTGQARASEVQPEDEPDASDEMSEAETGPKHHRPLRPALSISERVIPIQLVDTSGTSGQPRSPRRKQLRKSTLVAILGRDLDPERMSVERPEVLVEGPDYEAQVPSERLGAALRALNASLPVPGGPEAEAWLLRRATCPVRYVWEDVGALFWPRWIKRGECVNDGRRSCSWPPGMLCVPAESAIVHLLRWHCRPRSRRSTQAPMAAVTGSGTGKHAGRHQERADPKQFRCQWLKVPYPVTDKCYCSC